MRSLTLAVLLMVAGAAPARGDHASEALQLLDRGISHFQAGRLEEARDALTRARDLVPDKANPHRWLGLVDARMGRCDEAVRELEAFIERVPRDDPRAVEAVTLRDRCVAEPAAKKAPPVALETRPVERPRNAELEVTSAPPSQPKPKRYWIAGVVVGAAVVVALGVGLGVGLGTASSPTTLSPIHGGSN
jgi:tetratricopeptide (TPR) repeat protein